MIIWMKDGRRIYDNIIKQLVYTKQAKVYYIITKMITLYHNVYTWSWCIWIKGTIQYLEKGCIINYIQNWKIKKLKMMYNRHD